MILVAKDSFAGFFKLLSDLRFVVVVEPVPLMTEPDTNRYAYAELMRFVEQCIDVICAPGADGIAASSRQFI